MSRRTRDYTKTILLAALVAAGLLLVAGRPSWHVERKIVSAAVCIVPHNYVRISAAGWNISVDGEASIELLYIKCSELGCNNESGYSSVTFELPGGEADLGPSIVHLPLLRVDGYTMPPSEMSATERGVVKATWSYPTAKVSARISIDTYRVTLLLPLQACSTVGGEPHGDWCLKVVSPEALSINPPTVKIAEGLFADVVLRAQELGCTEGTLMQSIDAGRILGVLLAVSFGLTATIHFVSKRMRAR
ncbi:MAG: hypothetical protein ABWW70_05070 [Thermoproteota archaeon]